MAISLQSPGIKITEADQITNVGSVGTTTGASVGDFSWGPINAPTLVTSEQDLVSKFGAPTTSNNVDFICASSYLAYSASQYVVRCLGTSSVNATSSGTGVLIENDDAYEGTPLATAGHWVAKHAGVLGNSLKVVICENATGFTDPAFSAYKNLFDIAPGTSDYVQNLGGSNDELHVVVVDEDGEFTGIPGTILEKYELVSKASDARGIDGGSNYYVSVINNNSKYIRWANHIETSTRVATIDTAAFDTDHITFTTAANHNFIAGETVVVAGVTPSAYDGSYTILASNLTATTFDVAEASDPGAYVSGGTATVSGTANWGTTASGTAFIDGDGTTVHAESLTGGVSGAVNDAARVVSLGEYANKLNTSIDVIICGPGGATVVNEAASIAGLRKDCVAVFSPGKADVVSNSGSEVTDIETFEATISSARGTYSIADSNWKYAYDKYNDAYVWVPCNPDVAGCIARVDANRDPWFSPAGYENGRIQNAIRLAWNPNQTERDTLYKLGINSIISQPGRGTILFGDKTFTQKKTAFSRINVRRLFITMQDVIGDAAGDVLFDQNDDDLREGFAALVEAYLTTVQAGRGIVQYKVVCDDTNNPTEVVQANEFVCDIFVQPTSTVNFIQLNFVSAAGDTAFSESE